MAAMLTASTTASQVEGPEKKKMKRSKKTCLKRKAEAATPDLVEVTTGDVPPASEKQAPEPAPHLAGEDFIIDESSPGMHETSLGERGQEALLVDMGVQVEQTVTAAPLLEPIHRPGTKPSVSDETGTEATSHIATEESDPQVPFHHKLVAIGKQRWKELRGKLIGDLEEGYSPKGEPSEDDRHVPGHFLHKEDSILLSGRSQIAAIHQFALQKDMSLLKEVPSAGLRLTLQSYHTRAALVGEELYDHLDVLNQVCGELRGELTQEKKAREEAEKRIAALEAEKKGIDAKWTGKLEKKQSTIANLQANQSKLSTTTAKLVDEMDKLGAAFESSQREAVEQEKRIECLEKELETKKRAKLLAQESALSDQLVLQNLKVELEDSRAAIQTALADAQTIEARLKYVTSEEGKKEVIEAYRQGSVGKVELTLAVNVGFNYLRAQLPLDALPPPGPTYPPRVQNYLSILLDIEKRGQVFNWMRTSATTTRMRRTMMKVMKVAMVTALTRASSCRLPTFSFFISRLFPSGFLDLSKFILSLCSCFK